VAEGGGQDSVGSAVCLDVGRAAADPSRRLPVRCVSAPAPVRRGVCARAGTHARVEIKKTARRRRTRLGCPCAVLAGNTSRPNVCGTDAMPSLTHPLALAGMYVMPRRAKIGSAYHVHKDLLALYSGRLTLANGTFLLLYTAWLQWTPRIVDQYRTW
jgi:hypothetical protein